MIKLCIFDLDGTLLDTLENITYFVNLTMKKYSLGALTKEQIKLFTGEGAHVLISRCLAAQSSKLPVEKVLTEYSRLYNSNPTYLVKPYPGIVELLKNLKKEGVRCAVLSNKPDVPTKAIVDSIFGQGFFYAVCGQTDNNPKKPDPAAVFEIIKGFPKNECVFIGDTKTDMETGRNAGIKTIGVLWGFRTREELEEAWADYIVSDCTALFDIIKNN